MATESPWKLVRSAARRAGVEIVELSEADHAERIREVIDRVWGDQPLPRELIRAMQHAGAVIYGAKAGGELVGFGLGFLGDAEGLHLHSHMLAVVPGRRDRGTGLALKLAQRAACLDRGIGEVRWTYDPLVARNARFNLVKLGAPAHRFLPDFYGEMTDRLNRGDRSDRFEVRWPLASVAVDRALHGEATAPAADRPLLVAEGDAELPRPAATGEDPHPGCTVAIPRDHHELKARDPGLARAWREAAAACFRACFEAGLVAAWLDRAGTYVFTEPSS